MIALPILLLAAAPQADLAPCPGINPPIRRPPGSNCLGILPRQCGANRARRFVGRVATPALRDEVARMLPRVTMRWITPGQPVTQDLRPDRLNLQLDRRGRIALIDCY
jgi:hypothetical protein